MPMTASDFGAFAVRITEPIPVGIVNLFLVFMMWAVMMVAMMLPSAAPMILMYARIAGGRGRKVASSALAFAAGYIAVWTIFSAAATAIQLTLERAALAFHTPGASAFAGAAVLIAAGIYQVSPLKEACLGHCQSPVGFFMTHWSDGRSGAARMGLSHGFFCVGCCWILMLLLFVVGVMNLLWVAMLTAFILIEKVAPFPRLIARSSAVVMVVSGVILAMRAVL